MGWKENIAYCLVGLGALSLDAGDPDRAARLLGQAERLQQEIPLRFEPYAERVRLKLEEDLRTGIGADRLDALRAEGRSLSMEQAVAEALEP